MPRGTRNHPKLEDNSPQEDIEIVEDESPRFELSDNDLSEVRKYHSDYLRAVEDRNAKLEEDPKRRLKPVRVYDISAGITAVARRKARALGFLDMTDLRKVDGVWSAVGVK